MLHADKQALERRLTLNLLHLRQKELAHLTNCCFTLAKPAALFAGFAYIAMSQVSIPDGTLWWVETLFFEISMIAMVFEIAATIRASFVGLMGPALALRGRPGSMHRAVETMGPCFMGAWFYFVMGLIFIFFSTMIILFMQPRHLFNSVISASLVVIGMVLIYRDMGFLHSQFDVAPEEIVGAAFTRTELSSMVRQCAAQAVPAPHSAAAMPDNSQRMHHALRASPTEHHTSYYGKPRNIFFFRASRRDVSLRGDSPKR